MKGDGRGWMTVERTGQRTESSREGWTMSVGMMAQADWVKTVLFDRGYLSRIRGEAIKVYLVILDACEGRPDQTVTISLSQLAARTRLSNPTVVDSLARLESLGLVVSTTRRKGRTTTYYVADPPMVEAASA